jgi:hypothetical protein
MSSQADGGDGASGCRNELAAFSRGAAIEHSERGGRSSDCGTVVQSASFSAQLLIASVGGACAPPSAEPTSTTLRSVHALPCQNRKFAMCSTGSDTARRVSDGRRLSGKSQSWLPSADRADGRVAGPKPLHGNQRTRSKLPKALDTPSARAQLKTLETRLAARSEIPCRMMQSPATEV